MRKVRGIIALVVSICLGLLAAMAVSWHLNRPVPKKTETEIQSIPAPKKIISFTESIPEGKRAFNIEMNKASGVSRMLKKGDIVDIVAVSPMPDRNEGTVSRIILEKIVIHSIETDTSEKGRKSSSRNKTRPVSLLVSPEQGAVLAAAAQAAEIKLLARNSDDERSCHMIGAAYTRDSGILRLKKAKPHLQKDIKSGMRAVTIKVRDTDGICGRLQKGDRVDIIVTCPVSRFASGGDVSPGAAGQVTEYSMTSRVLLQNIEILTTETTIATDAESNRPVGMATVLVSPSDAEKLAVISDATKKSIIRLVSRNINDGKHVSSRGQNLTELLTEKREYYGIDVIRGTKATRRAFFQ